MTTRSNQKRPQNGNIFRSKNGMLLKLSGIFLCAMLAFSTSRAQSPTQLYDDIEPYALDYMSSGNQYMLLGQTKPATVAGYSNANTIGGYNARLHLQIVDPANLNTLSSSTYVMQAEIDGIDNHICTDLSVAFYAEDAKETSSGDFVICGKIISDNETGNCNTPAYHDPFIMKVDAAGSVLWFKWYSESNFGADFEFRSIVEDPGTGNIIVCGGYYYTSLSGRALAMGVDMNGKVLWHHTIDVPLWSDPARNTPTVYNEVTPYTSLGGSQYYVLTGSSFSYLPSEGGVIITTVDANGNIINTGVITSAAYQHSLEAQAVEDAIDGDVVITGSVLEYAADEWYPYVLKIDPLTLTVTFLKKYPITGRIELPYSIDTRGTGFFTEDFIYVTGDDRVVSGSSLMARGAFYMKLDMAGNFLRYDLNTHINAEYGIAIINDPINDYPVYSCYNKSVNTALITDKYANNFCASSVSITPVNLQYDPHTSIPAMPLDIYGTSEVVVDDAPVTNESLICGMHKPGRSTGVNSIEGDEPLVISPNPAHGFIDIQLPDSFKGSSLNITDVTGKIVQNNTISKGKKVSRIDISNLAPGMYIMTIEGQNTMKTTHFIKK